MPEVSHRLRIASALFLAIIIVSAGCPSVVFADSQQDGHDHSLSSPVEEIGAIGFQVDRTTSSNTSSRHHHVNPSKANRKGKISDLKQWYASQLSSRIGSSTININKQKYDKAHSLVGSKYDSMLEQYVNVTKETNSKKDDNTAKDLHRAQERQQTYVDTVRRYRNLHQQYQNAKKTGNDRKARRIARKLNRLQSTVKNTDDGLTRSYGNISKSTGRDFHTEVHTIHTVTKNISEQQVAIRKEEFTKTRIVVTSTQRKTSYRNPFTVTGQLQTENGTSVANRTIYLRLTPNHIVSTRTSEDGSFVVSARPRAVHLGKQSFDILYVPSNSSVYLGTNTTVSSTVSPTKATVVLDRSSKEAAFGRRVTARGSVRAAGRRVSNVPVVLFVDGEKAGTTRTNSDGSFGFHSKLPLNTSSGKRQLRVQLPFDRRALKGAKDTSPIRIRETSTLLTLDGNVTQGRNVTVQGKLTTKNEKAITNQTIGIFADGKRIGTAQTDANGTYRTQLRVPPRVVGDQSNGVVALVAKYRDRGTNLAASHAQTRVTLQLPGADSLLDHQWLLLILGGTLLGLLVITLIYAWRTRRVAENSMDSASNRSNRSDGERTTDESTDSPNEGQLFIDQANATLADDDPIRATELAYAAMRAHLETKTPVEPGLTHREFYDACLEGGIPREEQSALETITDAYEQATFAAERISNEEAHNAIGEARDSISDQKRSEI